MRNNGGGIIIMNYSGSVCVLKEKTIYLQENYLQLLKQALPLLQNLKTIRRSWYGPLWQWLGMVICRCRKKAENRKHLTGQSINGHQRY